jgi:phosphoribosylformimino-5-aminoimidazole carboxamide ribotide isomerase
VLDLSCRRAPSASAPTEDAPYIVMTDRWQRRSNLEVTREALEYLAGYCGEFLVHAVDSEGTCRGIERELVAQLGAWSPIPVTYAGGAGSIDDLALVERLSGGRVDLTIGSALDLFGGTGVSYADAVAFNRRIYRRDAERQRF